LLLALQARGFDVEEHAMEAYLNKTYIKMQKLGEGNSGSVWKVLQKKTGECFAMKLIRKKTGAVSEKGLETEINCLRKLQHRHIVNIVDSVESSRHLWIIMECAEGGALYDRIVQLQHFSERSAAKVVKQLLKAVHYMHSYGVVHRDLKPENILLMSSHDDSDIKVADFGLAVILNNGLQGYRIDESMRMKAATGIRDAFCGSPICMAPEVARRNAAYGPQCDIWSVGCITYELLSGRPPFNAATAAELFRILQQVTGPSFSDWIWSEISSDAKDLVTNMLMPDPADRLSAREALDHDWFRTAPDRHNAEAHENIIRRATREGSVASYATTATQYLYSRAPSRATIPRPSLRTRNSESSYDTQSEATRINGIIRGSCEDDLRTEITRQSVDTRSDVSQLSTSSHVNLDGCGPPRAQLPHLIGHRDRMWGEEKTVKVALSQDSDDDDEEEVEVEDKVFRIARGGLQTPATHRGCAATMPIYGNQQCS
jgi:serine/threonine protein kinase